MKITGKSKVLYIIGVCCIIFLLWLGDEGNNPLAYFGSDVGMYKCVSVECRIAVGMIMCVSIECSDGSGHGKTCISV